MNKLDRDYQALLQDILDNGVVKKDRTGTGTKSVFGRQIRHKMSDGFPLLTTKKMAWKPMVVELLWFLQGGTNIQYLVKNNCHIWDGDAYKNYIKKTDEWSIKKEDVKDINELKFIGVLTGPISDSRIRQYTKEEFIELIKTDDEFADRWGELGPIYGKQWRHWRKVSYKGEIRVEENVDQIQNLMNDLKNNPDSRRLMVNAWNVGDIDDMVLPPCHYGFQCYTRELTFEERFNYLMKKGVSNGIILNLGKDDEKSWNSWFEKEHTPNRALSLMWNQRSCDFPLGIPMNIASYGLLLIMLADELNMVPDELIGNLGDCHIYLNQIDGVKEQLTREPFELPSVKVQDGMYCSSVNDVILENYQSHPKIYFPLSN
ncbi:MAG: thymidylate synthase [Methanobacterium sp.]